MLLRKDTAVRVRITLVFYRIAVISGVPFGGAYVASCLGAGDWPPQSSGPLGLTAGILVGLIVFFEMLLTPRKWLRGYRLLSAQFYMRWHIRLGFLSLPLVLLHSGFALGGALPATVLLLFLAVFASGVWGLILQQWLPTMLLDEVPDETIQAESSVQMQRQAVEAERLLASILAPPEETNRRPLSGAATAEVSIFRSTILLPFFRSGTSTSPLGSRTRAENHFDAIQKLLPPECQPALARLRLMAAVRRQWILQARVQFWLHNWLLIHLPLSAAMTMLMVLHAVRALKYW